MKDEKHDSQRMSYDTNFRQEIMGELIESKVQRCPKCNSEEVEANTPRTIYSCGSSDYDQRPNTFRQSVECQKKFTEK